MRASFLVCKCAVEFEIASGNSSQTIWLSLHKCHIFVVPATLAVGDSLFSVCSSLTASNMSPLSLALIFLLFVCSGFDGDMQFYFCE